MQGISYAVDIGDSDHDTSVYARMWRLSIMMLGINAMVHVTRYFEIPHAFSRQHIARADFLTELRKAAPLCVATIHDI